MSVPPDPKQADEMFSCVAGCITLFIAVAVGVAAYLFLTRGIQ